LAPDREMYNGRPMFALHGRRMRLASSVIAIAFVAASPGCDRDATADAKDSTRATQWVRAEAPPASSTIRVSYRSLLCFSFDRIDVEETAVEVVVTVYEKVPADSDCPAVAVTRTHAAELKAPLGSRITIDGALK